MKKLLSLIAFLIMTPITTFAKESEKIPVNHYNTERQQIVPRAATPVYINKTVNISQTNVTIKIQGTVYVNQTNGKITSIGNTTATASTAFSGIKVKVISCKAEQISDYKVRYSVYVVMSGDKTGSGQYEFDFSPGIM